jgi:hypothetical protein
MSRHLSRLGPGEYLSTPKPDAFAVRVERSILQDNVVIPTDDVYTEPEWRKLCHRADQPVHLRELAGWEPYKWIARVIHSDRPEGERVDWYLVRDS